MKITAIINSKSPRAAEWQKVFGETRVEVCGWMPESVNVLGKIREVYMLKLDALSDEQYERMLYHIAEKFNQPLEEVAHELPKIGVPILAEDLVVSCDRPFFL